MAEMQGQEKKWRVEVWKDEHQWRQEGVEKRAQEEAKHLVHEEAAKKAWEKVERQAEEACKVQEEARAKEEAKRIAREAAEREEAAKRVVEAAEETANVERRALEERLWEAAGQWSEMAVAPLWVAKPCGRMTMGGPSTPGWR
ncbi:hypothetical protein ID866_11630 [Astraeus odoratus]|nr:hypothetical protein ID866_11630 [Astraeus odoratus]